MGSTRPRTSSIGALRQATSACGTSDISGSSGRSSSRRCGRSSLRRSSSSNAGADVARRANVAELFHGQLLDSLAVLQVTLSRVLYEWAPDECREAVPDQEMPEQVGALVQV